MSEFQWNDSLLPSIPLSLAASPSLHLCFLPVLPSSRRGRLSPLFYIPPRVLWSEPCCTTVPQSGSWATCSRISSTSRFFPGGSTSFVIFCCSVRGNAISWINCPSGLLSTCGNTNKNKIEIRLSGYTLNYEKHWMGNGSSTRVMWLHANIKKLSNHL